MTEQERIWLQLEAGAAGLSARAFAYRVVCALAGRVLNPFVDCEFNRGCNCQKRCATYDDLWEKAA